MTFQCSGSGEWGAGRSTVGIRREKVQRRQVPNRGAGVCCSGLWKKLEMKLFCSGSYGQHLQGAGISTKACHRWEGQSSEPEVGPQHWIDGCSLQMRFHTQALRPQTGMVLNPQMADVTPPLSWSWSFFSFLFLIFKNFYLFI